MGKISKIIRYIRIYGFGRTWFKVAGRARGHLRWIRVMRSDVRDVGVIGCGQFSFSTIGYVLTNNYGNRFVDCYDTNADAQNTFAEFFRINEISESVEALISNKRVRYVFVASNHASHADYAIQALNAGKIVYLEKPVAVTREQMARLLVAVETTGNLVYAGYNRPFSKAIRDLRPHAEQQKGPLTLNCFVSGHLIPADHWYRDPVEGTRICGNVGHWLDLAVHILSWRGLPDQWRISIAYSSDAARDDDISISLTSCMNDLVVIVLTARCEPFEGINETINFQMGNVIGKIDDFRAMSIWNEAQRIQKRYWPKDVGHEAALQQPYEDMMQRNWTEVVNSTLLMLKITDMVRSGDEYATFSFVESLEMVRKIK